MEAPQVQLDRDYFDTQITQFLMGRRLLSTCSSGCRAQSLEETLLEMLKAGEVLPNIDVEREVEKRLKQSVRRRSWLTLICRQSLFLPEAYMAVLEEEHDGLSDQDANPCADDDKEGLSKPVKSALK